MLPLQLPTIQNWNCHNCGGCCKQHLIEVTDEERQRILGQNWTAAEGVPEGAKAVVWFAGWPWRRRYRLAHRADGGCVFLDERGLCRIHAKFGEAAKPLPCRIYPYAFHPSGRSTAVSLRFSCPSVVANKGRSVASQSSDLKALAADVVPAGSERHRPPYLTRRERVPWPEFLRFVDALDQTIADQSIPLVLRIQRALLWTSLVDQSRLGNLQDEQFRELLRLLRTAAEQELPTLTKEIAPPTPLGQLRFRLHVAQYARRDTVADLTAGWVGRWRLLRAILRFSRGTGHVPVLQDGFQSVPFDRLEQPFGRWPDGAAERFERYLRVKIQGLHFCGSAYYGVPFVEGFQSLVLMLPVTCYLARWLAASQQRETWQLEDFERALAIADHHHGYSQALSHGPVRRRVRALAAEGDIVRLLRWYVR